MGPMIRGRKLNRRKVTKWSTVTIIGLMVWSLAAAPSSIGQEDEVVEPFELSAYHTEADAAPIRSTFVHAVRLVDLTPAIAHSNSQVTLPSQAQSIAWVAELGLANSLHGTTTGTRVLTESAAAQPGGAQEEEFGVPEGGLVIGGSEHVRAQTGRSYASARHSDSPRGYANSFLGNVVIGRRPGTAPFPPGTFDPDATYPGGEEGAPLPDTAPQGQSALLSIGSVASTSESFREENRVKSIAVAELNDLNIGNRTADGRCTNCIRIDFIRAETFVEANGQPGGARAQHRVTLGRACRRAFDGATGKEVDSCLPLARPFGGDDTQGLQEADKLCNGEQCTPAGLKDINKFFEENQIWRNVPGFEDTVINLNAHFGNSPKNGATATEDGQEASAEAEGITIELLVAKLGPSDDKLKEELGALYEALDSDDEQSGLQLPIPDVCFPAPITDHPSFPRTIGPVPVAKCPLGPTPISTNEVQKLRRLEIKLGTARSAAIARPGFGIPPIDGDTGPTIPEINIPEVNIPEITIPSFPAGGGQTIQQVINQGIQEGRWKVKLDWSSFKIKPWAAGDMAKGIFTGGMLGMVGWLGRRRLGLGG